MSFLDFIPGLNAATDIYGTITGNTAQNRALSQQLAGISAATGDINAAQGGAEQSLYSGQGTAGQTAYGAIGNIQAGTSPYTQTGANAAYALGNYQSPNVPLAQTSLNFDPSKVTSDPGTQFIMDQAAQTLSRSAAGRGALRSGGTLKDLSQYLTNLESTLYGQAYNRQLGTAQAQYTAQNQQNTQQYQAGQENAANQFNRLYSLSGQGLAATGQNTGAFTNFGNQLIGLDQNTANQIAQSRLQTGGNLANLNLAAGGLRAASTLGKANQLTSGIRGIGYDLGSYLPKKPAVGAGG